MRSFLVKSGEEVVIIHPSKNEVTGTTNKAILYYNGTGKGVYIAIGINERKIYIAHVTAEGATDIDIMEELKHAPSDTVD